MLQDFSIKNAFAWQSWVDANTDFYGRGVVEYAARWANLMESRMARGEKLEDIADETSHTADTDGITGFMYNCAVKMLWDVWEHGDALRKWHNLDVSPEQGAVANEQGGILNSCILTLPDADLLSALKANVKEISDQIKNEEE